MSGQILHSSCTGLVDNPEIKSLRQSYCALVLGGLMGGWLNSRHMYCVPQSIKIILIFLNFSKLMT
jgi:hypothetical protein